MLSERLSDMLSASSSKVFSHGLGGIGTAPQARLGEWKLWHPYHTFSFIFQSSLLSPERNKAEARRMMMIARAEIKDVV